MAKERGETTKKKSEVVGDGINKWNDERLGLTIFFIAVITSDESPPITRGASDMS